MFKFLFKMQIHVKYLGIIFILTIFIQVPRQERADKDAQVGRECVHRVLYQRRSQQSTNIDNHSG